LENYTYQSYMGHVRRFLLITQKDTKDITNDDIQKYLLCLLEDKEKSHRVLLSLTYSAGLRVSEVVNLKIQDLDKDRMLIHVRQAKGKLKYTNLVRESPYYWSLDE